MAGYFTKLQGHVYDGTHEAVEPLANGTFAEITSAGVAKITTTKDTKLRVAEKTTLYGLPALTLDVVSVGVNEVFFVENEIPVLHSEVWDESTYELPPQIQVRMKRPLPGEQIIMSVDDALYAALTVGNIVTPAAGGTVAV